MKITVATLAACLAAALVPAAGFAATPAQEQAFVDTYRKAFEGKDAKTLHSLMYTEGADPKALGFYRMLTTVGMGSKVASIATELSGLPLSEGVAPERQDSAGGVKGEASDGRGRAGGRAD